MASSVFGVFMHWKAQTRSQSAMMRERSLWNWVERSRLWVWMQAGRSFGRNTPKCSRLISKRWMLLCWSTLKAIPFVFWLLPSWFFRDFLFVDRDFLSSFHRFLNRFCRFIGAILISILRSEVRKITLIFVFLWVQRLTVICHVWYVSHIFSMCSFTNLLQQYAFYHRSMEIQSTVPESHKRRIQLNAFESLLRLLSLNRVRQCFFCCSYFLRVLAQNDQWALHW